jgi:phosphate acyltransferase
MPGTAVSPGPVAVDAMGGDHAPDEIIAGAVAAFRDHDVRLVLVGPAPRIRERLDGLGIAGEIPIVHAEETLGMSEGALASWRKPRSSVAVGCRLIRQNRASALVSAKNSSGSLVRKLHRTGPGDRRVGADDRGGDRLDLP